MIGLPARRRLIFWLIRAYIKRWKKTILFFFVVGIILAALLIKLAPIIITTQIGKNAIGIVGPYTLDSLPLEVQNKMSLGLTKIEEDGSVSPRLAKSWEVNSDGKVYTIKIRDDVYFQDRKKLTAYELKYNFEDATFKALDKNTIQFTLNEPFSPFLSVLSRPIFKKGLVGVGEYKIKKVDLNNTFISTLVLENIHDKSILVYKFYPTQSALKTAFTLGEVDSIKTLESNGFKNWPNLKIEREVSPNELVVIFFNTRDPLLSAKSMRQGLTYALPENFEEGKTASSPLSFKSFVYTEQPDKFLQNTEKAKELIAGQKDITITLKTDPILEKEAQKVAKAWEAIGVKTNIETTLTPPTNDTNFQAFLGVFSIPADPDQYVLWHSTQSTNITGFANLKIDKLLEDGRKTQDKTEREKIYSDFQKYLIDEAPAAFLYYPTVYTIKRK